MQLRPKGDRRQRARGKAYRRHQFHVTRRIFAADACQRSVSCGSITRFLMRFNWKEPDRGLCM
jgi:transposase InsO family protein